MEENNTPASGMQLLAQKAKLSLVGERELLSAGMAGVVQVCFTCSEDWDGLSRIAVFSNGTVSADVPESEWVDGVCAVPREVLECAGRTVFAGLYGTDGENVILPTVWCSLGRVEAGAVPACQLAAPANAPLWAQLLGRIEALEDGSAAGYQPPDGGIPLTDLAAAVQSCILSGASAYQKPDPGIPAADLSASVQSILGDVGWKYQKPSTGIPLSDLSSAAKTALGKNAVTVEPFMASQTQYTMSLSTSDIYDICEAGGDVSIQYEDPNTHEMVDCRLVRLDGFDSAVFIGCKVGVNTDEVTVIVFTAMNNLAEKAEIVLGGATASSVTISDTAGYYTSSNVEGALAEIGAQLDGLEGTLYGLAEDLEDTL